MKKYTIKRLSDSEITHVQMSDDENYIPFIPSGHNLENNHEVITKDLTEYLSKATLKDGRKLIGKVLRDLSQDILDIITGHFSDQNLTEQEVAQLKTDFASAYNYLAQNMPLTAKIYIDQINLDNNLVTQDILDDANLEYNIYKENYPEIVTF